MDAMISWFSGGWGWAAAGSASVGAVVLVHLVRRRVRRTVVFPATWLISESRVARAGGLNRGTIGLMLLRVLALLMLCAGMALDGDDNASGGGSSDGTDVVIVLDASASMSRAGAGGATLFETARARAMKELQALDPALDRATVIVARAEPNELSAGLTNDIASLRRLLSRLDPTLEACDGERAMRAAREVTSRREPPRRRRTLLITDGQSSGWAATLSAKETEVEVALLSPGDGSTNASVSEVRVSPARPMVGMPAEVSALVSNHSREHVTVRALAREGDAKLWERVVQLGPGAESVVSGEAAWSSEGLRGITVEISAAGWSADNRAFVVAEVRGRVRAAVLTAGDPAAANSGARAAQAALGAMHGADARAGEDVDGATVEVVHPAAAARTALWECDRIVVVEAGALDEATVESLRRATHAGASVAWFLDSRGAVGTASASLFRGETWLPISRVDERALGPRKLEAFKNETGGRRDSEDEELVAGAARALAWEGSVFTTAAFDAAADSVPLLRAETGETIVISRRYGAGRVTLLGFDAASARSPLACSPGFALLMDGLCGPVNAARSSGSRRGSVLVGQPAELLGPAGVTLAEPLHDEAGQIAEVRLRGEVIAVGPMRAPGVARHEDSAGQVFLGAVNLDPAESDHETVELNDRGVGERASVRDEAKIARATRDATAFAGLSGALLTGALCLLAVEAAVRAMSSGRVRKERP